MPDGGIGRMDLAGTQHPPGKSLVGPLEDAAPGEWLRERTTGTWLTVGALVPSGFPAYARIFHPAYRVIAERGRVIEEVEVRWADVAAANGRVAHAAMQWPSITGSERYVHAATQPGIWDQEPCEGTLPAAEGRRLTAVLRRYTSTPERCWFALWDGHGHFEPPPSAARLAMPHRPMLLFRGPIDAWLDGGATARLDVSPSLWWPEDRSWCVATDVDLMTTYVAGSAECVETVVASPGLEAAAVTLDQPTTWDGDTVNPPPA